MYEQLNEHGHYLLVFYEQVQVPLIPNRYRNAVPGIERLVRGAALRVIQQEHVLAEHPETRGEGTIHKVLDFVQVATGGGYLKAVVLHNIGVEVQYLFIFNSREQFFFLDHLRRLRILPRILLELLLSFQSRALFLRFQFLFRRR